ncbi:basic amino acid ABC transporter substrate-binding protein [Bacillus sp. FJAT-29790]|uniref:basic amino acid ABC transporter substrate-binding protein n=1 Tax=Bacillus sp. FJAT-29790 TaxID=1895002 RepID=UPI001C232ECE|nr:basic amino acid ABC transporter substrate-binding protein [Bacillus sp. FJAT-29790]MBU8880488.1 basic amino acid ABC transporter substrate-binding protein [Bacillus sp. FJAT-29790]
MRKFTLFTLVMIFTLILAACGSSQTSNGSNSNGEKPANNESNESDKEKKKLKIGTDAHYPPFQSIENGVIVGFDADLLVELGKETGYEYEYVNLGWEPLFLEVKDGISDFGLSAITISDDRKQTYDFSVPYFLSTNKILVSEGSDIKSIADLEGKVVAIQNGASGQAALDKVLGKNNPNVKKFENNGLVIMELASGGADAAVADNATLEEYVKKNPDQKLVVVEDKEGFDNEFYGMMFQKGSPLKAEIDAALTKLIDNGTYAEIYEKWFGVQPDLETLKE